MQSLKILQINVYKFFNIRSFKIWIMFEKLKTIAVILNFFKYLFYNKENLKQSLPGLTKCIYF